MTMPTRWLCPQCLILDEHDTIMKYDEGARRQLPHTRCRHCGKTIKKPDSLGIGRGHRPSKPQVKCPRCHRIGSSYMWHGMEGVRIHHPGDAPAKFCYVRKVERSFVLAQINGERREEVKA